jgi:hypothetical protein
MTGGDTAMALSELGIYCEGTPQTALRRTTTLGEDVVVNSLLNKTWSSRVYARMLDFGAS